MRVVEAEADRRIARNRALLGRWVHRLAFTFMCCYGVLGALVWGMAPGLGAGAVWPVMLLSFIFTPGGWVIFVCARAAGRGVLWK